MYQYYVTCVFFTLLSNLLYASFGRSYDAGACCTCETCSEKDFVQEYVPFDADLFHKQKKVIHLDPELLLWTIQSGSLYYAASPNHCASSSAIFIPNGRYERTKYNWTPGFRLTMGFFHAPHYWNACAQYTFFTSHGSDHCRKQFLIPTWPSLDAEVKQAKSSVRLQENLINLVVSRVFFPNPHLRLKILGGITAGAFENRWHITYKDAINCNKIQTKWTMWGIGPRIGVHFDWYWFCHIYFTGKATFGGILGGYHNRSNQKNFSPKTSSHICYRDYRFAPNIQYFLGYSWQYCFNDNRVELVLGYEFNDWENLQEIYYFCVSPQTNIPKLAQSSLMIHGGSLRFTLDF